MYRRSYVPDSNINLLAALAARCVEETVALGRAVGLQYPKAYDVGFRLKEHPNLDGRCEITIRLGTTRHTYQDRWNMRGGQKGAETFMENLQRQASIAVHMWSNDNPSFAPDKESAEQMLRNMEDTEWLDTIARRAHDTARNASFTYPWGKLENH
jgi:hypothetical protein